MWSSPLFLRIMRYVRKTIVWFLFAIVIFAASGWGMLRMTENTNKCPDGTWDYESCANECEAQEGLICVPTEGGTIVSACYSCEDQVLPPEPVKTEVCPEGTTSLPEVCNEQCANGLCTVESSVDEVDCYSCIKCPDQTLSSKQECDASCDRDCEKVAEEQELSCWQCPLPCKDRCEEQGYRMQEDYSDHIAAKLLTKTCVSGISISIPTASIGTCKCTNVPEIEFDERVPVCSDTPCGDVVCGDKSVCEGGKIEVECLWQGWEKLGVNQFRPGVQTHITQIK